MQMLKSKLFNTGITVLLLIMGGCSSKITMKGLIPESKASPEKAAQIRKIIGSANFQSVSQRNQYTFEILPQLLKMGKETTPFVIEKIVEILKAKPQKGGLMVTPYPGTSQLIYTLSKIKDSRALPILEYWTIEIKWRILRGDAAGALGTIGDPHAVGTLWNAWNQEIGYLKEGDTQGPGAQFGYHFPSGTVYSELAIIGKSLYRLGEKESVVKLIELIKTIPDTTKSGSARETIGYFHINQALGGIIGKNFGFATKKEWEEWWKRNKYRYR